MADTFDIQGPTVEGPSISSLIPETVNEGAEFNVQPPTPIEADEKGDTSLSKLGGSLGAGIGAVAGGGYGTYGVMGQGRQAMQKSINRLAEAVASPPAAQAAQAPDEIIARIAQRVPEGGPATFKYAKQMGLSDEQAYRVADYADAQRQLRERQAGIKTAQRLEPSFAPMNAESRIAVRQDAGGGPSPRFGQEARAPLPQPPTPQAPQPNPLSTVFGFIQRHPILSKMTAGAMSGYGTVYGGLEAARKYQAKDIPGAVLSGLGAAGAIGSVIPFTAPVAAPLAVLAPIVGEAREGLKEESRANLPARRAFEKLSVEPTQEEIDFYRRMGPAISKADIGYQPY